MWSTSCASCYCVPTPCVSPMLLMRRDPLHTNHIWEGENKWEGKNVLLFGSEGYGIKAKTLEKSDFKFCVTMNDNIESLNISNTVSIVCHHIFQSIK